jgi:hypothetical protein
MGGLARALDDPQARDALESANEVRSQHAGRPPRAGRVREPNLIYPGRDPVAGPPPWSRRQSPCPTFLAAPLV